MNLDEILRQLQAAQGDPEKLTLATLDLVLAGRPPTLRTAFEAAAIPHWFDAGILGKLLKTDQAIAEDLVEQLQTLPMVESFAAHNGWNVHESTRLALRKQLRKKEAERFHHLSNLAAKCFEADDPASRVENVYHRLLSAPEEGAAELEQLWKRWNDSGRYAPLQTLGVALIELIRTDYLAAAARARSLVCLGLIRRGQLTLKKSEEYARESADLFHRLGNESGEADARDLLGDTLQLAGDLPGALAEYRLAQQIAIKLAQRDPDNANLQRDLSVSHNKMGSVQQAQGSLDAALQQYQSQKEILERLTKSYPENTNWQRELSIAHNYVGDIFQAQRDLKRALEEYKVGGEILRRLAQKDPENTRWQNDLSVNHNRIGVVLQEQGDLDQALKEYEVYRQITFRLTQRDPENSLWQRELSVAHQCVGAIFESQGLLAESLAEFEAALVINERLINHDATNMAWQTDLEITRECVERVRLRMAETAQKEPPPAAVEN